MSKLATIRTIRTRNFTIRVDALEESDLDLSFDDTGEIQSGLESGRLVAFCARVTVYLHGAKVGTDYLGGCIYKDFDAFQDHFGVRVQSREASEKHSSPVCVGSYFSNMIRTAIGEARKTIADMQSVTIRS